MSEHNNRASPWEFIKSKKWLIAGIVLIIVIIISGFGFYYIGHRSSGDTVAEESAVVIGSKVKSGEHETAVEEQEEDHSMISVELDAYPTFEDGTKEGNLNIVNPISNSVYLDVEIILDDTGAVIYNSGAIPPNSYIDSDKLSIVLEKGEYQATATVHAYDPENPEVEYNQSEFSLVITILN